MDQLKSLLAVAMKYGFWIGCVLISVAALAFWYMSTSNLASETESESRRLESMVNQISSVSGEMDKVPNELSHEVMRTMVKKRQDEVLEAWQTLFNRQKRYLTWPVEALKKDFVDKFEGKIPIEQYIKFPAAENELSPMYLQRYRDHIKGEPAKLAAIAGAKWTASDDNRSNSPLRTTRGGEGDIASDFIEEVPVVAWDTESQKDLEKDLFRWTGVGGTPTTLEIYYSQESQWIMRQLMTIIKEVNGDATQPYQGKIRRINEIKIGGSVNFNVGDITSIQGSSTGSLQGGQGGLGGSSSMGPVGGGGSSLSSMGGGGGGTGGIAQSTVDPAEGRYVDKNLVHITAEALRTALESNKPADASLAVAKRVPIMLGVTMDQRTVHELLAACGSADLMVEVTHVRVLGESSGSSGGTSSSGRTGGGLGGLGALGGGTRSSSTSSSSEVEEYPFDVKVEIRGMIYIYNPPDSAKLPVEQVTKETVEEALGEKPVAEVPPAAASDQPLPETNEELQPPVTPPAGGADTPATEPAPAGGADAPAAGAPAPPPAAADRAAANP